MIQSRRSMIDYERCIDFYLRDEAERDAMLAGWLRAHPEIARRARRDAVAQIQLKRQFDPVLDEPIPPRLLASCRPSVGRWPVRMGMAVSVVLAAAGGWWIGQARSGFAPVPAFSQRVVQLAQQEMPAVRLAAAGGEGAIRQPDLSAQGYALIDTRTLHRAGAALTEFTYRNARGQRLRVYAQVKPRQPAEAPQMYSQDGVSLARWRHGDVDYALVGDLPQGRLHALAQSAADSPKNVMPRAHGAASAPMVPAQRPNSDATPAAERAGSLEQGAM